MAIIDNLISYWKLDGNSTDAVGSNDGTDTSITYSDANGIINNGAGFNGVTSKINIGSEKFEFGTDDFSVSCWIKTTQETTDSYPMIISSNKPTSGNSYGFDIFLNNYTVDDKLYFSIWSYGSSASVTASGLRDGGWHHLVGVKTSTTLTLYVDGTGVTTTNHSLGTISGTNTTVLGAYSTGITYFYDGELDEVGIWSRALTSNEVTSLYNSGAGLAYPLTEPDLTADFTLGEFTLTGNNWSSNIGFLANLTLGHFALTLNNVVMAIKGWVYPSKNDTSYTGKTKNTSSYTNKTKNGTSYTYKTRN